MTIYLGVSYLILASLIAGTSASRILQSRSQEAVVRALDDQERVAVLNRDRAALERLWSERLTVNAPTNRVNVGRASVLDLIARGGLHYSEFARVPESVRIVGDVALVMGAEVVRSVATDGSVPPPVYRRFTNVWRKEGTSWRMIARHANNLP